MSRKYKFYNKEGIYFVNFAVVYWMDVFVRAEYFEILVNELEFFQREKGMILYSWCIMPSHVHLIFRAKESNPSALLRDFKRQTSRKMLNAIEGNDKESKQEWMLWMFERAGKKKSNVIKRQFWQHHNKPIELWSNKVIDQKMDYIHNNPVKSGFVDHSNEWRYSSAKYITKGEGVLDVEPV